jgi:hypothetical protein
MDLIFSAHVNSIGSSNEWLYLKTAHFDWLINWLIQIGVAN